MKKIAVIYKSQYGSTRKYAQWIAEELNAALLETDRTRPAALQDYDVIIYGGGLYAGGISGISLITKNFKEIQNKDLYLFTVGAADVTDPANTDAIRKSLSRVLTPDMREKVKLYHLRGGMDCKRMRFLHRAMMGMMFRTLRKKPESELRADERAILEAAVGSVDFTDRAAISPLIEAVRAGCK